MSRNFNILSNGELDDLVLAGRRDEFGPFAKNQFLCVDCSSDDSKNADWLKDLPCPVIGIGDGKLRDACDVVVSDVASISLMAKNIKNAPLASMVLVQQLRASETLTAPNALVAESFAYGTIQTGPEFISWKAGQNSTVDKASHNEPAVRVERHENKLSLILNRPKSRNEIDIEMRDALCEALDLALADNSIAEVNLTGTGKCFSIGGAVHEFGKATDPATAHWVRSLRLPAWRIARLSDRCHVHVNGAAIGAGAEVAAFAGRVTASPNAWFQLPELTYGLIPGAGGTVSLPRRIGHQRTAYLALSMKRLSAETALEWGLVDAIES